MMHTGPLFWCMRKTLSPLSNEIMSSEHIKLESFKDLFDKVKLVQYLSRHDTNLCLHSIFPLKPVIEVGVRMKYMSGVHLLHSP